MDNKAEPSHQELEYGTPPRKRGVLNTLYPPGPRPGAKGRMKNHCRKFWWCDCLVLIVVVLVIVLPIIYVGIPNKAQHDINASKLEVAAQHVTETSPEGIQLKIDAVVRSGSSYHPTIEPFRAALSLKDQPPFLYVDVPKAKSKKEFTLTIDQKLNFASNDSFSQYTKAVLAADTFDVHMDGKTKLKLSGLPKISVNYNKVIRMKGLNKLAGLNITDLRILSGRDQILPDGSNLIGNVSIPNPTVMTLDLGNVTMNLAVDGKPIGYTLIPNLFLKPGDNVLPMQSRVDQLTILGLVQSTYKDAVLPVQIVGNSSIGADGSHLTYYEDAIKSNVILLNLDVKEALAGIGINVTSQA
ncbi:hypothetical protein T440DRAFT_492407 [Plenodomus tracheiphilus IPT5]|uniref:Uncharacterized protein n=1 Tax=Plenodomus tracheiphilus IPT5 TaxID=1408161 RepID=A0A6A7AUU5_9PLEO|nr:hypothetical protein T440DRAFT_492407 [Plenodomus tracheiphilus IPT5]